MATAIQRLGFSTEAGIREPDHDRSGRKNSRNELTARSGTIQLFKENIARTLPAKACLLHHSLACIIRAKSLPGIFTGFATALGSQRRSVYSSLSRRNQRHRGSRNRRASLHRQPYRETHDRPLS